MLVNTSTAALAVGNAWVIAREERARLKATRESGIVDWAIPRPRAGRYEAYWRGMSIGRFLHREDAQRFLAGLG